MQVAVPPPQDVEEHRPMDAILADVMSAQKAMRDDFDDLEALRLLVNDTKTNLDTHISSVNNIRCNTTKCENRAAGRSAEPAQAFSRRNGQGLRWLW